MPALQRSVSIRGPRFFKDGDDVMFVNHVDGSTREGPRKATRADKAKHAPAYEAFKADAQSEGLAPLIRPQDPVPAEA